MKIALFVHALLLGFSLTPEHRGDYHVYVIRANPEEVISCATGPTIGEVMGEPTEYRTDLDIQWFFGEETYVLITKDFKLGGCNDREIPLQP